MSAYHTIYSLEHIDYNKNYETGGSLLIKMLQAIQLPVCIVYNSCEGVFVNFILYRDYDHNYCENDVCGSSDI